MRCDDVGVIKEHDMFDLTAWTWDEEEDGVVDEDTCESQAATLHDALPDPLGSTTAEPTCPDSLPDPVGSTTAEPTCPDSLPDPVGSTTSEQSDRHWLDTCVLMHYLGVVFSRYTQVLGLAR